MSRTSQFADLATSVNNIPGNIAVVAPNVVISSGNIVLSSGNAIIFNTNVNTTVLTLTTAGTVSFAGALTSSSGSSFGNLAVTNTTAATSSTTGALRVAGGVGVGGNIIVSPTGNVGIGTSSIISGNAVAVYGGNIFVSGGIQTTAFVGIGTQSLYNPLAIQGTSGNIYVDPTGQSINFAQNTYNTIYGGQSGNYIQFNTLPGTTVSGTSNIPVVFSYNGSAIGQWLSGGQFVVGIASNPPSGSTGYLVVNPNNAIGGIALYNKGNGGGNIAGLSPGGLSFSTFTGGQSGETYTQRMLVNSLGNVGIGTSTINSGNSTAIYGGNLFIAGNLRISNTATQLGGIQFADGTFQATAPAAGLSQAKSIALSMTFGF